MALRLPQSASLPPIQYKGRKVPVDQIIQIMGQNPLAAGLDTATQSIAAALEKRNLLRKQAAQMAQVEAQTGLAAGSLTGLPLDTGVALAKMKGDATSEAAKAQATAQDKAADRAFKERQQTDLTKFRGQLLSLNRQKADAVASKEKAPTSEQSKAGTFAARAVQAERDLGALKQEGFKLSTGFTTKLPEMMKPASTKQFEQAKANFISAVLRKESGAAISPAEYEAESRKYFEQPGDDPRTLQQKQVARLIAIRGLQNEAKGKRPEIDAPDVGSLQTLLNVGAAGGSGILSIERIE